MLPLCISHLNPLLCNQKFPSNTCRYNTAGCGRVVWEPTDLLPGDRSVSGASGPGSTAGSCQPQPRGQQNQPTCLMFPMHLRTEPSRRLPSDILGWQVHAPSLLPKELALCLSALPRFFGGRFVMYRNQIHSTQQSFFLIFHLCNWITSCLTTGSNCSPLTCRKPSPRKDARGAPESGTVIYLVRPKIGQIMEGRQTEGSNSSSGTSQWGDLKLHKFSDPQSLHL